VKDVCEKHVSGVRRKQRRQRSGKLTKKQR
jgi:hypothetical protein